jgi:uncharacterized membrane protein YoaK (UPF0700 family)
MDGPTSAPPPSDAEPARGEGLVLSAVSGAVDGVGYLLLHVFTAHVTGNTVHGGIALGRGELAEAGRALLAIALFAGGVAAGALLRDALDSRGRRARPAVLALSAALLGAFALAGRGLGPASAQRAGLRAVAALAAAAVGIGCHNAVAPRVGGRRVRTFVTGTIVELVEALAAARRTSAAPRRAELHRAVALLAVWLAYLAGATACAAAALRAGSAAALLPAGALVLVAVRDARRTTRAARRPAARRHGR